jgi:DNA-binding transcriptional LysR family regulator
VGERLLHNAAPRLEEIEAELRAVVELREKPAGTIRITATEYAADAILLPKLAKLLRAYPDIKVEIIIDYGLTDIVAQRYDAGVRSGEQVAKDMIAVRIGPDMRMAVVGAPSYFRGRSEPKRPQDLIGHNCIALRLPHGGLYSWEFEKGTEDAAEPVDGQTTSANSRLTETARIISPMSLMMSRPWALVVACRAQAVPARKRLRTRFARYTQSACLKTEL